jgi:hypothetical protein
MRRVSPSRSASIRCSPVAGSRRLGVPKQTLRETAEPLVLHFGRIKTLQTYAIDALFQAACDGHKATRPGLRVALIEGLQQMIREDPAGGANH